MLDVRRIARPRGARRAFTLIELMAVLASLLLLACVALPVLANNKPRAQSVTCFNNLRQIGQAFQVWASDHNDRVPFATCAVDGGTMMNPATCNSIGASWENFRSNPWFQFSWISNELRTPKILACDTQRLTKKQRASIRPSKPGSPLSR